MTDKSAHAEDSSKPPRKKVILSGIQPSGALTIGNYIGAVRNWVAMQEEYHCYFMVVDLHSITVRQQPADLRQRCYDFVSLLCACGIDPERSTLFLQSHVHQHAELAWIIMCNTQMGELERQTQYKDKAQRHVTNVNAGLFTYPVLMAADILLYQADLVPVGEDQKQHLELSRDVAQRFNHHYGDTFTVPDPYIPPVGARVMSLQDPTKKMSKSDENSRAYISLLDDLAQVRNKIKRAVTDSGSEVRYDESRPGISNLMAIYSALTDESYAAIADKYAGKGYADFKNDLAEITAAALEPVQQRYKALRADKSALEAILKQGAERAERAAARTLDKVYKKVGFVPRPR